MKILCVNTNQARQPYPVIPIGLCSLASAISKQGHEVEFLDLCFIQDTELAIREKIRIFEPELIAVGIRNLDNSDLVNFHWFLPDVKRMINQIKKYTKSRMILGGAAVSVMPQEVMRYLECEWGIVGDGEKAFSEFVRLFVQKASDEILKSIEGVVSLINGQWTANSKLAINDYEEWGPIEIKRWVNVKDYLEKGSIFPVQGNRGCAFNCIYCTYTQIEGKRYRVRPVSLIVSEIREAIQSAAVDYFEFVDSIFNVPEAHAKNVCRGLIDAKLEAKFGAAGINPKFLSDELLDLMEQAGFASLDVTIESASPQMLKKLNKGFEYKDVISAAEKLSRRNMKILWVLLLGGPGETEETLQESFEFIENWVRPSDSVYITAGIRIYPLTPLAAHAQSEGIIKSDADLIEPTFYLSDKIGLMRMKRCVLDFARRHPNVIASFDTDNILIPFAYRVLNWIKAKKPFWQYSTIFNKIKNRMGILLDLLNKKYNPPTQKIKPYYRLEEIPV